VTMDRRVPEIRLNRLDLPTLGRPTMAISGTLDGIGTAFSGLDVDCVSNLDA